MKQPSVSSFTCWGEKKQGLAKRNVGLVLHLLWPLGGLDGDGCLEEEAGLHEDSAVTGGDKA